jgi:archaeosine synthase beta-subunit
MGDAKQAALDPGRPVSLELVPAVVAGKPSTRLAVVLRAPGCRYARATGGCRFCGFLALSTRGAKVTAADYRAQIEAVLEAALAAKPPVEQIDLYNSGSFLADQEVPAEARTLMLSSLTTLPAVQKILIEARPEDVSRDKLRPLVALLSEVRLEVGIGLESADDRVRAELMRKGFSRAVFERAAGEIRDGGASLLAYVFLKPAGLGEAEARDDAVATAHYLAALRSRLRDSAHPDFALTYALQPAFVARESALEAEWTAGRYQLLNLWTVLDVAVVAGRLLPVQIGLWDEDLAGGRVPCGCAHCSPVVRDALRRFNETADLSVLTGLPRCACAPSHPGERSL